MSATGPCNGADSLAPVYDYLATPYTHDLTDERALRAITALCYVEAFFAIGRNVFSPIAYLHQIAMLGALPDTSGPYRRFNFAMLIPARRLVVVRMPGWESSVGVADEIDYAKARGKTIEMLDHDERIDRRARIIAEAARAYGPEIGVFSHEFQLPKS